MVRTDSGGNGGKRGLESSDRGGFTLIELMIVVAIIAIILALAIPSLQSARLAANEGSAIASLRGISAANQTYRTRFGSFATSLTELSRTDFIDPVLGRAEKSGYTFSYAGARNSWLVNADPVDSGTTGNRHFYVDTSGVIRFREASPASSADTPVDN